MVSFTVLVIVSSALFRESSINPFRPAVTLAVILADKLADREASNHFSISVSWESKCLQTLSLVGVVLDCFNDAMWSLSPSALLDGGVSLLGESIDFFLFLVVSGDAK